MKRRKFLQQLSVLGAMPFALEGIPLTASAKNSFLSKLAAASTNDNILIILQLHGGNDGINTVIPIGNYDRYYNVRPNIAIPEKGSRAFIKADNTLETKQQIGFHPDMIGVKDLYDQGKIRVVQGVSYENANGSHFRGRDIVFMGGGADDYLSSGWIGRFMRNNNLPKSYPDDFPNPEMLDPLALEFGFDVSLIFHQPDNIPVSINIDNPGNFFDELQQLIGFTDKNTPVDPRGFPPNALQNSPYFKELMWILGLEKKTDDYAKRLQEVFRKTQATSITYPDVYPFNAPGGRSSNPLSNELKVIARLIEGGCKTKVYLIGMGGFDTHANQVETFDPTMGNHAALVYHMASAMKAFQDDLKARGVEDRVLTITTSEFGRRIFSNGSYGTDHGTGQPILMFGKWVNPGVTGDNPDMTRDNISLQYDYRQLYTSILKDWMGATDVVLNDPTYPVFVGDYPQKGVNLPVINKNVTSIEAFINERFQLNDCFPNPATDETTISFKLNNSALVKLDLTDINGDLVKNILNERKDAGEHQVKIKVSDLKPGMYLYRIEAGLLKNAKKLIVVGE